MTFLPVHWPKRNEARVHTQTCADSSLVVTAKNWKPPKHTTYEYTDKQSGIFTDTLRRNNKKEIQYEWLMAAEDPTQSFWVKQTDSEKDKLWWFHPDT